MHRKAIDVDRRINRLLQRRELTFTIPRLNTYGASLMGQIKRGYLILKLVTTIRVMMYLAQIPSFRIAKHCLQLQREGWDLTVLPVDANGLINLAVLASHIRPDTALISIMHSNNEIGTIQSISAIARIARARGVLLHVDAAQSIDTAKVDVKGLGIDALTFLVHKFYAPKGIEALYAHEGTPINPICMAQVTSAASDLEQKMLLRLQHWAKPIG